MTTKGFGNISLELVDNDQKIKKAIEKAMLEEIAIIFDARAQKLEKILRGVVPNWLDSSPELASLKAGSVPTSLGSQLGLTSGQADAAIADIKQAIGKSIQVEVKRGSKLTDIQFNIYIQPANFENLLSLTTVSYTSEGTGTKIPWLEWLLLAGTKTIISGYTYVPDPQGGRAGGGYMELGGVWRIPPQFSGTEGNNFITRAFLDKEKQVSSILEKLFKDL